MGVHAKAYVSECELGVAWARGVQSPSRGAHDGSSPRAQQEQDKRVVIQYQASDVVGMVEQGRACRARLHG
jgi:hypothetical protein